MDPALTCTRKALRVPPPLPPVDLPGSPRAYGAPHLANRSRMFLPTSVALEITPPEAGIGMSASSVMTSPSSQRTMMPLTAVVAP